MSFIKNNIQTVGVNPPVEPCNVVSQVDFNVDRIPLNTIINGNCLDVLKKIPDCSIDLIFADPPYNMQTEGDLHRTDGSVFNGVSDAWDKFTSVYDYDVFSEKWLAECRRILKKDGSIWVIGSFQNIYRLGYIMQNLGYWILNDVIWSKPNAVPNFAGTRFQNAHETLLWCSKDKRAKYHFNYQTMKAMNAGKQMKSVWDIGICIGNERLKTSDGKKVHSTQKPEKLLYNVIASSSKLGDIVLDPFFGTGTTGAVAKLLGRNFIGIEQNSFYIEHARLRINSIHPNIDAFAKADYDVKPPKFTTKALINLGILKPGQLLYDKTGLKTVTLLANGNVTDGVVELSIHKMSGKLKGVANNNGWDYFYYKNDKNMLADINSLRYIAEQRSKEL